MPKASFAVHPGEILSEVIKSRNLNIENLFSSSGVRKDYWKDFLAGKICIDQEKAEVLENFTGVRSSVWINAQKFYDNSCEQKGKSFPT
jgi:plasmid maintenance system antidote protein VapI